MALLALTSGAYSAQSIIANAQRCVNLYPEANPQGTTPPVPVTHYLCPGLRLLTQFPDGQTVRCLYRASNNELYGVCGPSVYWIYIDTSGIAAGFNFLLLGTIAPGDTPVKMADNGQDILIVDGTSAGYSINLLSHAMSGVDATNNSGTNGFDFSGGNYVDFQDGFLTFNVPESNRWGASADNTLAMDPLSYAEKTGSRDYIIGLAAVQRYQWIIGTIASEVWYNAGNANFPFAVVNGPYIEHGCAAQYSIVKALEAVLWIGQDKNGSFIVLKGEQFRAQKVSNPAIEAEWSTYPTIADAVGYSIMYKGHVWACWRFPEADKTWVYDLTTGEWHERTSTDSDEVEHQWRPNCSVYALGMNLAGDYSNGNLYEITGDERTDNGSIIVRRRGFPHRLAELKRVRHTLFRADIAVGEPSEDNSPIELWLDTPSAGPDCEADDPFGAGTGTTELMFLDPYPLPQLTDERIINLRLSSNRGQSFGTPIPRTMGQQGEFLTDIQWRKLGIARDRVYELFWTSTQITALNGAYVEEQVGVS